MKRYKYIFHFGSGNTFTVNSSTLLNLPTVTSLPWGFVNEREVSNLGGVAININNVEFIEMRIIDEK